MQVLRPTPLLLAKVSLARPCPDAPAEQPSCPALADTRGPDDAGAPGSGRGQGAAVTSPWQRRRHGEPSAEDPSITRRGGPTTLRERRSGREGLEREGETLEGEEELGGGTKEVLGGGWWCGEKRLRKRSRGGGEGRSWRKWREMSRRAKPRIRVVEREEDPEKRGLGETRRWGETEGGRVRERRSREGAGGRKSWGGEDDD
ncbi:hypothetical protein NN561_002627 [Cricetulus griseus]